MDIAFSEEVITPAARGRGEPVETRRERRATTPPEEPEHIDAEPMGR